MKEQLDFDVEILTSEIIQKMTVPLVSKKNIQSKKTMANMSESKLLTNVKVRDLIIDLSYQRKPNYAKVSKIVRDFDPNALGVIICSMRENGTIAIIDGGHRITALNAMGLENDDVRCLVFFDLSLKQEAEMFTILNDNRTKPKTLDLFKSKVVAKDPEAVEINRILVKHGLEIVNKPSMNGVRAIGTLSHIHKKYGSYVLSATLDCLIKSFGKHTTAFTNEALYSVSEIIGSQGTKSKLNLDRLVEVLKGYGTAHLWESKGSIVAKQGSLKKVYYGMIFVFVGDYNKRLKSNKIEIKNII